MIWSTYQVEELIDKYSRMVAESGKEAGMCLNHISGLLAVRLILHLSGKESASMDTTVYPSLESIINLCLQEVDQATGKKAVISSSTPADKSKTESTCASASAAPSKTVADIHSKRIALGERFALGDCVIRKGAPAEGLWQVQAMKETEVNLVQAG